MSTRTVLKLAALLFCVVVVLIGIAFFFTYSLRMHTATTYSTTNTPYAVLVQNNPAFVQAEAAVNAGQYDAAKQLYEQALAQAQDVVQKGQIAFKLAVLADLQGNSIQAIDQYKAIVADPDYDSYKIVKAYAVQSMAEIYYRNGDPAVTAEIFKDAPYSQMYVAGNLSLSYRNLEQYATTFYPLALPELRIAEWYASNVNATTTPAGESTSTYPALIQSAISLADADVTRITGNINEETEIPTILVRKESLYETLYRDKLASAQDAEQAAQAALNMFASVGTPGSDGFARYYYALLLVDIGPSSTSELQGVLAPFYEDSSAYASSTAFAFFASEKNNELGQKRHLVKLASLDPSFKTLLVSLGWKASDF